MEHCENLGADLSSGEKDVFYHLLLSYADVLACSTEIQDYPVSSPVRWTNRAIQPHSAGYAGQGSARASIQLGRTPSSTLSCLQLKFPPNNSVCPLLFDVRPTNMHASEHYVWQPQFTHCHCAAVCSKLMLQSSCSIMIRSAVPGYRVRRTCMTGEPMENHSARVTWSGYILVQLLVGILRSYTAPGRVPIELSVDCQMQHSQLRRKRLVVHFDRLKPCSPDTRLTTSAYQSRAAPSLLPDALVGTDLELLADDPNVGPDVDQGLLHAAQDVPDPGGALHTVAPSMQSGHTSSCQQ